MWADLLIKKTLRESRNNRERFHPSFNMMDKETFDMMDVPASVGRKKGKGLPVSVLDRAQNLASQEVSIRRGLKVDGRGYDLDPIPTARERLAADSESDFEDTDRVNGEEDTVDMPDVSVQRPFVPAVTSSRTRELLTNTGGFAGAFVRSERGMSVPVEVTPDGKKKPSDKVLLGGPDHYKGWNRGRKGKPKLRYKV